MLFLNRQSAKQPGQFFLSTSPFGVSIFWIEVPINNFSFHTTTMWIRRLNCLLQEELVVLKQISGLKKMSCFRIQALILQ
jgi:hypothetical protein